jgi:hypothetical protein
MPPLFACYMDPFKGDICSSFRLRPPVRLRNMLPCPIALAVLDDKDNVPQSYVSLLPCTYYSKAPNYDCLVACLRLFMVWLVYMCSCGPASDTEQVLLAVFVCSRAAQEHFHVGKPDHASARGAVV